MTSGEGLNEQSQAEIEFIANEQVELADLAEMLAEEVSADAAGEPNATDDSGPKPDADKITIDEESIPELEFQR